MSRPLKRMSNLKLEEALNQISLETQAMASLEAAALVKGKVGDADTAAAIYDELVDVENAVAEEVTYRRDHPEENPNDP